LRRRTLSRIAEALAALGMPVLAGVGALARAEDLPRIVVLPATFEQADVAQGVVSESADLYCYGAATGDSVEWLDHYEAACDVRDAALFAIQRIDDLERVAGGEWIVEASQVVGDSYAVCMVTVRYLQPLIDRPSNDILVPVETTSVSAGVE